MVPVFRATDIAGVNLVTPEIPVINWVSWYTFPESMRY